MEAGMKQLPVFNDKCRHFTGIQHKTCAAGVKYMDVRDSSRPGPYRWPCISMGETATTECAQRSLLTQEEHAARYAEIEAAVAEAVAKMNRGECHVCGKPVEPSRVIGRCKYGACGHRQGQVASGDEYP